MGSVSTGKYFKVTFKAEEKMLTVSYSMISGILFDSREGYILVDAGKYTIQISGKNLLPTFEKLSERALDTIEVSKNESISGTSIEEIDIKAEIRKRREKENPFPKGGEPGCT